MATQQFQVEPNLQVGKLTANGNIAVPPTANIRKPGDFYPTGTDALARGYSSAARREDELAALRLTSMMMEGRPKHMDGRYYTNLADLVRDASQFQRDPVPGLTTDQLTLHPLSNEFDPDRRFDEVRARIAQMSNLLTIRSDVFSILATVQSGYGIDVNGDGKINYRSDHEFITTGESKIRAVYERRSPADRSDQAQP